METLSHVGDHAVMRYLADEWVAVQVDQLLAPQFREDLVRLDQHVGRRVEGQRQTILVSATLSDKASTQTPRWSGVGHGRPAAWHSDDAKLHLANFQDMLGIWWCACRPGHTYQGVWEVGNVPGWGMGQL
jgi:hypothetical protein